MLNNVTSEKIVLATVLRIENLQVKVFDKVLPKYFFDPTNKRVFEVLQDYFLSGKKITDDILLSLFTNESEAVQEVLFTTAASETTLEHHIKELIDSFKNRKMLSKVKLIEEKIKNNEPVNVTNMFKDLDVADNSIDMKGIPSIISDYEAYIEAQKLNKSLIGIGTLDRIVNPSPGDLIIIGARPSMGKTAFVVTTMINKAKRNNGCCMFSLEMPREKIIMRALANVGNIQIGELTKGEFTNFEAYKKAKENLISLDNKMIVVDQNVTIEAMVSFITTMRSTRPDIEDFFIDHLGFIKTATTHKSEHLKYGYITKALKEVAKRTGSKIWLLSQLSRGIENRTNRRPLLSDLRESGSIEEDADIVLGLYRQSYYDVKEGKLEYEVTPNEMEILVLKNRDGPTSTAKTWFNGKLMKVSDTMDIEPKVIEATPQEQKSTEYEYNPEPVDQPSIEMEQSSIDIGGIIF